LNNKLKEKVQQGGTHPIRTTRTGPTDPRRREVIHPAQQQHPHMESQQHPVLVEANITLPLPHPILEPKT